MTYGIARPAKLLVDVEARIIGTGGKTKIYRSGKICRVQRSTDPGLFIIWFRKDQVAKVDAIDLPATIAYTDGRDS